MFGFLVIGAFMAVMSSERFTTNGQAVSVALNWAPTPAKDSQLQAVSTLMAGRCDSPYHPGFKGWLCGTNTCYGDAVNFNTCSKVEKFLRKPGSCQCADTGMFTFAPQY